jgi:hypothetical protein
MYNLAGFDLTPISSMAGGDDSRGPFLTSPLGANFDPKGEVVPRMGVKLAPGGEILCSPLHSSKQ